MNYSDTVDQRNMIICWTFEMFYVIWLIGKPRNWKWICDLCLWDSLEFRCCCALSPFQFLLPVYSLLFKPSFWDCLNALPGSATWLSLMSYVFGVSVAYILILCFFFWVLYYFINFLITFIIQLLCLLAVIRCLKQSGPREENLMKRRAFYVILITMSTC